MTSEHTLSMNVAGTLTPWHTHTLAYAQAKQLAVDELVIKHVQVNQAPVQRRRTYRAHGRIGPYQSHPCHIEMVLVPEVKSVEKASADKAVAVVKRRAVKKVLA